MLGRYRAVDIEEPKISLVCNICGSVVFDTTQHNSWHSKAGF